MRLRAPEVGMALLRARSSGGTQQRVNIARGFIEPTASRDAAHRRAVVELVAEAKARGTPVVGIFHDEEVRDAVATCRIDLAKDPA